MKLHRRHIFFVFGIAVIVIIGISLHVHSRPKGLSGSIVRVERGDLELRIQSTGTVQSQNRLEIKPPTSGRVEEILINEGSPVKRDQIIAWMSSSERVSLLDAARAKGRGEVRKWKELYRATPVISPLDGMLILSNVKPGQTVASTDVVFVVSDRLIIQATIDETDISHVSLGQACRITLDAYSKTVIPAKVARIAYDAKTVNNVTTYQVDIVPDEVPDFMKSGMTANVSILAQKKEKALLLPSEAIHQEHDNTFVLEVEPNGQPGPQGSTTSKEVEIGLTDGKRTEIVSGLNEGEMVLLPVWSEPAEDIASVNPFMPTPPGRGKEKTNGPR